MQREGVIATRTGLVVMDGAKLNRGFIEDILLSCIMEDEKDIHTI